MSGVDIGKLLLATAENAAHLTGRMQSVIAQYCEYQAAPVRIMGMPVKVDPNLRPDQVRFEHPDGRKDTVQL